MFLSSRRLGPCCRRSWIWSASLRNPQDAEGFSSTRFTDCCRMLEEMIYSALEDFRMDILTGTGPGAATVAMDIKKFTAIKATTGRAPVRRCAGDSGYAALNHYDQVSLRRLSCGRRICSA